MDNTNTRWTMLFLAKLWMDTNIASGMWMHIVNIGKILVAHYSFLEGSTCVLFFLWNTPVWLQLDTVHS